MKGKKFSISKMALVALIALGGVVGSFKFYELVQDKPLGFDIHHATEGPGIEKWIKFDSKKENFSVFFPNKPEYLTKAFPIPRSDDTLPYHEYQCTENAKKISVSYTVLPEN